jgi:hypothetical protein
MKYVAFTFSFLLAFNSFSLLGQTPSSHDPDGVKVNGWNVFEK